MVRCVHSNVVSAHALLHGAKYFQSKVSGSKLLMIM